MMIHLKLEKSITFVIPSKLTLSNIQSVTFLRSLGTEGHIIR